MKLFAGLTLGAATALLISVVQAAAGLSGDYTIIFYSGPSHQRTASQCVTFTNTGGVVGFPDSGTWGSSTVPGWGGNFIVDGKMLRWYGTFGAEVTNLYNKIKNDIPGRGGFDDWQDSAPPITANDDGTTRLKAGCKATAQQRATHYLFRVCPMMRMAKVI